jgi:2-polyprenyl-3-methyl-5-hydroxy-6-metoxy-1,4-benzoquinol methylase
MLLKSPLTDEDSCELISSISSKFIIDKYKKLFDIDVSGYFKGQSEIFIYQCKKSKLKFYLPSQIYGKPEFYKHFSKYSWYYRENKWEFNIALTFIDKSKKVLEFGCGDALFLDILKSANIECAGVEINLSAIEKAKNKGHVIFNEELEILSKHLKEQYDIICSFQVLEHINNLKLVIENLLKILKKGGYLIISVPNNDSFIKKDQEGVLNMPPHHMILWDETSLRSLESLFNLKIKDIFFEPLQEEHYEGYYRIISDTFVNKTKIFGKILRRIIRPLGKIFISLISNRIIGQNILVVYEKLE